MGRVFSLSEVQQCWSDVMNSLEAQGKVMRDLEDGQSSRACEGPFGLLWPREPRSVSATF